MQQRSAILQRLQSETFDLCIIGGGASGAGCALDAALRGLKVVLIERTDFAAETSSRSTKLIHGGVRYLEQAFKNFDFGQLRQVRHGLEERHTVLANAPHLAHPLPLITPVFSWWEGLYFRIGLWLYDWFASGKDTLPASRWLSKKEVLDRLPRLSGRLHSAVLYYDGQLDDARYCLALAQSAAEAGAVVLNHAEITGFEKDNTGKLVAARFQDKLQHPSAAGQGVVRARLFLNCTGPFADPVRQMANPGLKTRIRPSKGVHLVLPTEVLGGNAAALLIPKTPDGRVVFAIPFQGGVLLGTTDEDYPDWHYEPVLESDEVDFLLETLQPYLANQVDKKLVRAGFGGVRPLIAADSRKTRGLVRDHEVEYDPESNLLSLLGGKWTTYRLMARDAVDAAAKILGNTVVCRTAEHPLFGGENYDPGHWQSLVAQFQLAEDIARHLQRNYGSRAGTVAQLILEKPGLGERLAEGHPFIRAEVVYAVRSEMAYTLRDVLARRIRLEILDWQAVRKAAPAAAGLMAEILGWSAAEEKRQLDEYDQLIGQFMASAGL